MLSNSNDHMTNTGGRSGFVVSADGELALALSTTASEEEGLPQRSSPEQLLAAAIASSYAQVLIDSATENSTVISSEIRVTAAVALMEEEGEEILEIVLEALIPGCSTEEGSALMQEAYDYCPYCQAVYENVTVHLNLLQED